MIELHTVDGREIALNDAYIVAVEVSPTGKTADKRYSRVHTVSGAHEVAESKSEIIEMLRGNVDFERQETTQETYIPPGQFEWLKDGAKVVKRNGQVISAETLERHKEN